jgi:hypothetical protein
MINNFWIVLDANVLINNVKSMHELKVLKYRLTVFPLW